MGLPFLQNHPNVKSWVCFEKFKKFAAKWAQENMSIWANPEIWPFFGDKISELFFHSCGPRIPKWNSAHLAWSKQAKNIRKTPKNSWFTAPCFRTRQPGYPVDIYYETELCWLSFWPYRPYLLDSVVTMIIDKLSFCNVANFRFKRIIFIAILIVLTQRPIKLCNYTQAGFPMEPSVKFCIMKQKFYDNDLAKF